MHDLKEAPLHYRNNAVVRRVTKDERVPPETAAKWFAEMLRFLDLANDLIEERAPFRAVPSRPVDAAWHAFILHTAAYCDYCEQRFGAYLHHEPTDDGDPDTGIAQSLAYLRTRIALKKRHGPLDEAIWPLP